MTLAEAIRALRDRDCPYLGNYKLGYDAALDDVLELSEIAARPKCRLGFHRYWCNHMLALVCDECGHRYDPPEGRSPGA